MRLRTQDRPRPPFLRSFVMLGLLLSCCVPAWCLAHARHAARDQILGLETAWVSAQRSGDAAAMEKLLAPDFLGITASGQVLTKMQQLDRMRSHDLMILNLDISDVKIKLLGERAAIVTSLAQLNGSSDGRPLVGSFRYTHVYQKLPSGMWRLTSLEATRIPGSVRTRTASAASPLAVQPPD